LDVYDYIIVIITIIIIMIIIIIYIHMFIDVVYDVAYSVVYDVGTIMHNTKIVHIVGRTRADFPGRWATNW